MRDLNTPITSPVADKQYVNKWGIHLKLDNAGGIDMQESYFQYVVTSLPEGGSIPFKFVAANLPASFKAKLKDIHNDIINHATANGIMKPGTDTDDL